MNAPEVRPEWIRKISNLSRLELNDKELGEFLPQLQTILEHVESLSGVNTCGADGVPIEPFLHPLLELSPGLVNDRVDAVSAGSAAVAVAAEILERAPAQVAGSFEVPQVVSRPDA